MQAFKYLQFTITNLQFTMVFPSLHLLHMRQIKTNLKFTITNLQFTMDFITLHPSLSSHEINQTKF